MAKKVEKTYGVWTCPACGEENTDPEEIKYTICHKQHPVTLGPVDKDGNRSATLRKETW